MSQTELVEMLALVKALDEREPGEGDMVGMAVEMPGGKVEVVIQTVGQWKKWFQDGTILLRSEK